MFYFLFKYLSENYDLPGIGLFEYISFRSAFVAMFSFLIVLVYCKRLINYMKKKQVNDEVRDLGLKGQKEKEGTPTMGGIIIIISTLLSTLLFSNFTNIYVVILMITLLWMGFIGFLDDYIKVFKKKKAGLAGKFKILGQISLGVFVGTMIYLNPEITIKEKNSIESHQTEVFGEIHRSTKTTIPFLKNNEFDYADVISWIGEGYEKYAWVVFIFAVVFIITAVSNGANLTDGMDGLAAGVSSVVVIVLGLFAWISGNIIFSDYLNIMYIPQVGEITVFVAAFVGAIFGFLWYNTFPAQIFMGDVGSLSIGGCIAVIAILIRKELLIPLLCGVFFIENLTVIFQVCYFKYTRKRFGTGRRIFLMTPIHHHFQKKGIPETKIVTRFWIIQIVLAIATVITLKIR